MNKATSLDRDLPDSRAVAGLKTRWLARPNFDLEDVPGFEAYTDELRAFRKGHEERWRREAEASWRERAARAGCPGDLELGCQLLSLDLAVDFHRRRAAKALCSKDREATTLEHERAVTAIIAASVAQLRRELLGEQARLAG